MNCIENVLDKYAEYLKKFLNDEDETHRTGVSTFGHESKI